MASHRTRGGLPESLNRVGLAFIIHANLSDRKQRKLMKRTFHNSRTMLFSNLDPGCSDELVQPCAKKPHPVQLPHVVRTQTSRAKAEPQFRDRRSERYTQLPVCQHLRKRTAMSHHKSRCANELKLNTCSKLCWIRRSRKESLTCRIWSY
jgi:hypothetical protein